MKIRQLRAVCFSPTGTTRKIISVIAETIRETTHIPCRYDDMTLPAARRLPLRFAADELVIFGIPVYAGRVPNILLNYLAAIKGNDALAVPMVVFGNRDYDDALIELRDLLEKAGLHTIAAAAFIGEHAFSRILAENRPDEKDLGRAGQFASALVEKCRRLPENEMTSPIEVKGVSYPYRKYYVPRDAQGNPADIRKVKPLTHESCNRCNLCVQLCPMGSIDPTDPSRISGICIKCGACIKKCPLQAKYYDDASYLHHQQELEKQWTQRAEPEIFL